ncbi:hypothetical protein Cni_G15830 [Canna indica]|uniref:Cytochrome P450 n=1 Tax=Canna indica TaxID=4628 RepID=A0AAQ3QDN4_9LILI|nr:hypothetical protein Cni_G15830 [Canna indica]
MSSSSCLTASISLLQAYHPEILFSFVLCFIFCYYYDKGLLRPDVPVNWPLAGMLPGLLRHLSCLYDWTARLLGRAGCTNWFYGPWFLDMNYLITCDPANVQHVFSFNFFNYPKGDEFSEIFDILGDGIFRSDGELWKKQRMRAHVLVTDRRFRAFVARSSRDKVERGLVPLLDEIARRGTVVDLEDVFMRLTFDLTSYLVFGLDPCCLSIGFPTIPFATAMDDATSALFHRHAMPPACWKLLRWLRIGKEKKLAVAREEIDRFIAKSIAEKYANLNDGGEKIDLLSSYINAAEDVERRGSAEFNKFLRDTAVTFMLAGRDTTGAALSWFFWMLYKNPMVELKILEELKATIREKERSSSYDLIIFDVEEVSRLVYLHAALCETLRLFPPVPMEFKTALQTDVLPSGHRVEQGSKILVTLYSMGRMEEIWGKDCMEFRPERWITEKGRVRHEPSYKFLSFNSGPRTCLGKEVAFTQMKAVVAAMLYNFQVEVLEGHVVAPKLSIILHMKNGLKYFLYEFSIFGYLPNVREEKIQDIVNLRYGKYFVLLTQKVIYGTVSSNAAQNILGKFQALLAQTSKSTTPIDKDEIYRQVIEFERHEHTRGYGLGPTPPSVFGATPGCIEHTFQLQAANVRNEKLILKIDELEKKMKEDKKRQMNEQLMEAMEEERTKCKRNLERSWMRILRRR